MIFKFKKHWGLILNLVVSMLLLILFFSSILQNPNTTYFSSSGDGLKSTYGSIYHLNYDTTYLRTAYMNYPFGESVFYTGGQPIISNSFKLLKNIGFDFSNKLLGFINVWMLFSIVLAALFIYLIFKELKLPSFYSILAGNIIAFMSPQMDRFGGHFNLAYLFFIPLMIYLFFVFYRSRKLYISIIIACVALFSLGTHAYLFGFFTFLILIFWLSVILAEKKNLSNFKIATLNIFVQFILPLILFQLLVWASGGFGDDRTSYPWGFFALTSQLQGIFLPINRVYGAFLHLKSVPWEGISYIGLVGLIGFIYILFKKIKKRELKDDKWNFLKITDQAFLNIIFWASIVALLFSLGLPFSLGLKELFNYMGPLKSFRAPGRYAWLFYYSINIISFYLLWNYYKKNKKLVSVILLILGIGLGSYDAYLNVRFQENYINNKIESLNDKDNLLEINKWHKDINFEDFQAIIPLPYFHIGSENYWIEGSDEIKKQAFIASIKSGLPLTAVMMGRTSMKQTILNLQLMMEPYNQNEILDYWPNDKALLIIIDKNFNLSPAEIKIRNKAELISSNTIFEIRKITNSDFREILSQKKDEVIAEIKSLDLFIFDDFLSTDSIKNFYYNGIGNISPKESKIGDQCYQGDIKKNNLILNTKLYNIDYSKDYLVSFWVENMDRDMYPRSNLEISIYDEKDACYYYDEFQLRKKIKIIDSNGWGLIEFKIKMNQANHTIKIDIRNSLLTQGKLKVDEILIRPIGTNIYVKTENIIYKNNRFYSIQ